MKVKHIVGLAVIAVIVAFFIVANCILFEPTMSTVVSAQLCPPVTIPILEEDEASSEGQAMSREIVEQGTVLAKNNGVLPLSLETDSGRLALQRIGLRAGQARDQRREPQHRLSQKSE